MEFFEFNTSESLEMLELSSSKINEDPFVKIKQKILLIFNKLGINVDTKSIYYERHNNKQSILAIKISNGKDFDMSNYMINYCITNYSNNKPSCDIGFHANAKVGQSAMHIANNITKDIIDFFETVEKDLFDKNLTSIDFSLTIPLDDSIVQKTIPKKNNFKTRIRSLFHK